jgi:hypothetical protein
MFCRDVGTHLISFAKYLFRVITACLVYVIGVALVVLFEPFITIPCDNEESNQPTELKFKNVLFTYTPCMEYRYPHLLFLTRMDCQKARHLLVAVFLGSLIGYERRSADRPAGIRTMALVSLGSALFTINSTFAFLAGPMVSDGLVNQDAIPDKPLNKRQTYHSVVVGCKSSICRYSVWGWLSWRRANY